MKRKAYRMGVLAPLLTAVSMMSVLAASAEDGLGELSGAGGVMRDAERRALAPASPARYVRQKDEVAAEKSPAALPKAIAERRLGPISGVRIFGSTVFAVREDVAAKVMVALGEEKTEGDKTVGDVLTALETVRQHFLRQGNYLVHLSLARTNAYDKATQTLAILIDEGRFGKISVKFGGEEDGRWFSRDQIYRRFKDIREGETFDYMRLRAALFDANSHPDLTIDTAINVRRPIEGEGENRRVARYADLDLNVHERLPLHAVWEINNYGLKDVNEWQTALTLQYLNLTKHDDVLTLSPAMSLGAELLSGAASYLLPHGYWNGGNTTLYGGWSQVQIDDVIPELDLEGTGFFVGLQHSENLVNDDSHLLALSAGLLWRYLEDQYTVSERSLNARGAHILPLTVALSYTGKRADWCGGRNFATAQGVFNLVNAGDDLQEIWNGAERDYWILRAQLARLQPLFGWRGETSEQTLHNWQLLVKVEGQYTDQTLVPTEKLMLGGYNCLRGYRTRGYVGDYGVYGMFELRTPLLVDSFASLFGDRENKVAFDRLQFLCFCDWGIVQYNDLPDGYDDNSFLCSFGLGARLAVTEYSQFKCDVAMPCAKGNNENDKDVEVYFGCQLQF